MGMYLQGEKIGYTQTIFEEKNYGYNIKELTSMTLSMMGTKKTLSSFATYKVDKNYKLLSFTFELNTEAQRILSNGKIRRGLFRKVLDISVNTGGKRINKEIKLKGDIYPMSALPKIICRGLIHQTLMHQPQEFLIFDPSIQAINPANCTIIKESGDSIQVKTKLFGATTLTWLTKDGIPLYEQQPMGIVAKRESQDQALMMGNAPEILTMFAIQSNIKIEHPREVKFLKTIVEGRFLENECQTLHNDTLIIQSLSPHKTNQKLKIKNQKYLESTSFIQCKDKRIVKLAKEITRSSKDDWDKVKDITDWVSRNIEDAPTVTMPSALDVLELRQGDCNEHSVLFVALARAIGIPSDIVVGLVYIDGGFYYHAWAKVWVGTWIAVDPTFGQYIADATHIALAEGELQEQAKIMDIVGKLKIRVIEYK